MKKIAILALTENGKNLAKKISDSWQTQLAIFVPAKFADEIAKEFPETTFKATIASFFSTYDALICIMATGIVVRSIAPVIEDKRQDPAIIVLDEKGQYVISLLSGHIGGGNQLAVEIAEKLEGTPVITTATDVQGVTALDLMAQAIDGFYADFHESTKLINGLLAAQQKVGLFQRQELVEDLRGLTLLTEKQLLNLQEQEFTAIIIVSPYVETDLLQNIPLLTKVVHVIPKQFVLGIGAKKNIEFTTVKAEFLNFCQLQKIEPQAIKKIVSIDLKKQESGICQLADWLTIPFETYSADALATVADKYPQSEFVKQTTGVGSVALAAADLASQGGVISQRYANQGVTLALADLKISSEGIK
ncbi:cobalt-precorrin 5A hydrolase [Enterococcus sp. PF1-24]|uniref:cobalt-precorrin 5A hydrolase n=1 Tax=unclassified Enterococcus TaxID=2608891 RepID=UPI002475EFB6|nr:MULTISPECIES: cobalt-precorrin 5A hydrolase [unclassified Enterococcus]MDH6363382.1 cobalt-precorrin 5A hydrolase [Enterococcus sp. PFB1-1]MDH6400317.1 cobalt-precorrin 5A hydrolase [Enterococcus sp. PF1-24]